MGISILYVRFTRSLLLGVMVIVLGAMTLTRLMPPSPCPFAAYADLISGGSSEAGFWSNHETLSHAAFELACATSLIEKYCLCQPEVGPFAEIRFLVLDDEGESGVYFAVRDNALTVGDMAHLWGRPSVERHEKALVLHWPDQNVSTVVWSDNGQFNYLLPIPYLLIGSYSGKPLNITPELS